MRKLPDVRMSVRNPQTFIGGGPNFDIDFALLGPDLDALYNYAEQLREKAPELGLQDADTTLKLDKPELRVEIDRDRAAELGVDTEDIATAVPFVTPLILLPAAPLPVSLVTRTVGAVPPVSKTNPLGAIRLMLPVPAFPLAFSE